MKPHQKLRELRQGYFSLDKNGAYFSQSSFFSNLSLFLNLCAIVISCIVYINMKEIILIKTFRHLKNIKNIQIWPTINIQTYTGLYLWFTFFVFNLLLLLFVTPTSGFCPPKTTDGNCCSIPFVYKGVTYNSCTKADHDQLWCSLDSEYKGNWGNCALSPPQGNYSFCIVKVLLKPSDLISNIIT